MSTPDFARLRPGTAGCPSDLTLDRLATAELPEEAAGAARAHIGACAACSARMQLRGFAGLGLIDERPMLAAIRRGLDERPAGLRERARRLLHGSFGAPLALAAGLCALVLVVRPLVPGDGGPRGPLQPLARDGVEDGVRYKGGLALHVYRQRGADPAGPGGSEEVHSGARFAAGDTLRFVVDLPSEGHVSVIGVEQGGALYTAWPRGAQRGDTRRPLGVGQPLPGAVSLDDAPGQETLYLIHCPMAAGPPACRPGGEGGRPACQRGCALTAFVVNKAR